MGGTIQGQKYPRITMDDNSVWEISALRIATSFARYSSSGEENYQEVLHEILHENDQELIVWATENMAWGNLGAVQVEPAHPDYAEWWSSTGLGAIRRSPEVTITMKTE